MAQPDQEGIVVGRSEPIDTPGFTYYRNLQPIIGMTTSLRPVYLPVGMPGTFYWHDPLSAYCTPPTPAAPPPSPVSDDGRNGKSPVQHAALSDGPPPKAFVVVGTSAKS